MALLEQAELLSEDVTHWVDEIEADEDGSLEGKDRDGQSGGPLERLKHLFAGLSAGFAFGCVASEV